MMLSTINKLTLFIVLCISPDILLANSASPPIIDFQAKYTLKHNGLEIGRVKLSVTRTHNQQYQLISESKNSGILAFFRDDNVVETSHFEIHNNALRPLNYQYLENLEKGKRNTQLSFDWENLLVTNHIEKHQWKLKIHPGVLDKALMQVALMRELQSNDKNPSYQIADGGHLKTYHFSRQGNEKININGVEYNTIKLARKKNSKPNITYYWCAEELHYLPVLLKRKKTYGTFQMKLESIQFGSGLKP